MKKVFIAATQQNDGKTTVALGLIFNFSKAFASIGFIKPVGQRYLEENGFKIDEDSILIEDTLKLCNIKCKLKDMSPVAVEKGFTEAYINKPQPKAITQQIKQAFGRISKDKDFVVIEGTGHAGVGSVIDHSNAKVAKILGAKVILISSGGIGRPIDEILLNKALFDKEGIKLVGVIINKVMPEKFDRINKLVRKGLKYKGVDVLGVIPYNPMLSYPAIRQILEETNFTLLSEKNAPELDNCVARIAIGAMHPKEAAKYITEQNLIITPGDRSDIIKVALDLHAHGRKISGLILSGNITPPEEVMTALKESSIPILFSQTDTYTTAGSIHDLTVKIRPEDKEKIEIVKKMIQNYVNLDLILKRM